LITKRGGKKRLAVNLHLEEERTLYPERKSLLKRGVARMPICEEMLAGRKEPKRRSERTEGMALD